MHANMEVARFLIEGREEQYLRHFFRDFAYNPDAISEEEVRQYAMQIKQPGSLRASLNHYASIPEKSVQLAEFAKKKADDPGTGVGGAKFLRLALHRQRQVDGASCRRRSHRGMRALGL